jgi:hypothetical protein
MSYDETPSIDRKTAYTVNVGSIANCDSLIFQINSGGKSFTTKGLSNRSSYTFSVADLGTLAASETTVAGMATGQINVHAYKYKPVRVGSKIYWMVNVNSKCYSAEVK